MRRAQHRTTAFLAATALALGCLTSPIRAYGDDDAPAPDAIAYTEDDSADAYDETLAETRDITIAVEFNDTEESSYLRPDSLAVHLLARVVAPGQEDGEWAEVGISTASAETDWVAGFYALPLTDEDGNAIEYEPSVETVPYYTMRVISHRLGEWRIVSHYTGTETDVLTVDIEQRWEDDGNEAGSRPESAIYKLSAYEDGEFVRQVGSAVSLTASDATDDPNVWARAAIWAVPSNDGLEYRVERASTADGYEDGETASDVTDGVMSARFTSSRAVEAPRALAAPTRGAASYVRNQTRTYTTAVVWNDDAASRPNEVSYSLYADGELVGTMTLPTDVRGASDRDDIHARWAFADPNSVWAQTDAGWGYRQYFFTGNESGNTGFRSITQTSCNGNQGASIVFQGLGIADGTWTAWDDYPGYMITLFYLPQDRVDVGHDPDAPYTQPHLEGTGHIEYSLVQNTMDGYDSQTYSRQQVAIPQGNGYNYNAMNWPSEFIINTYSPPAPTINTLVLEDSTGTYGKIADASTGEETGYKATITLPSNYSSFSSYPLAVEVAIPAAIELEGGDLSSVHAYIGGQEITNALNNAGAITQQAAGFTISVADMKANWGAGVSPVDGSEITVSWRAHPTSACAHGEGGNDVIASVSYPTSPSNPTPSTLASPARLTNYTLTITKVDETMRNTVEGGTFRVSTELSGATWWLKQDGSLVSSPDLADVLTTNEFGEATIVGLDAGSYTIVEGTHQASYQPIVNPIVVNIASSLDAQGGRLTDLQAAMTGGDSDRLVSGLASGANDDGVVSVASQTGAVVIRTSAAKDIAMPIAGGPGRGAAIPLAIATGTASILGALCRPGDKRKR